MAFHKVHDELPSQIERTGGSINDSHLFDLIGSKAKSGLDKVGAKFHVGEYSGPIAIDSQLGAALGHLETLDGAAAEAVKRRVGGQVQSGIASALYDVKVAQDALAKVGKKEIAKQLNEHVGDLEKFIRDELRAGKADAAKLGAAETKHAFSLGRGAAGKVKIQQALDATFASNKTNIRINGQQFDFHTAATLTPDQIAHNANQQAEAIAALREWRGQAHGVIEDGIAHHASKLGEVEEFLKAKAGEATSKTGVAAKAPRGKWGAAAPSTAVTEAEAAAEKAATGVKGKLTFGTVAAAGLGAAAALIGGKGLLTDIGMLEARRGPDGEPEKGNFLMDAAVTAAGIAGLIYAHRSYHGAGVGHTAA